MSVSRPRPTNLPRWLVVLVFSLVGIGVAVVALPGLSQIAGMQRWAKFDAAAGRVTDPNGGSAIYWCELGEKPHRLLPGEVREVKLHLINPDPSRIKEGPFKKTSCQQHLRELTLEEARGQFEAVRQAELATLGSGDLKPSVVAKRRQELASLRLDESAYR